MPPIRRKSSNPRATQPTLSFNNRTNRITKPSSGHASKSSDIDSVNSKKIAKALETSTPPLELDTVDIRTKEEKPTTSELAIRDQAASEQVAYKDEVEKQAEMVTDAAIKRYWKAKEDERKAPRVHQRDLSIHDKILREFDLSYQYGPCIGIARTKRWKRAASLGLQPPIEVLAVLLKENAKSSIGAQRAYPDELMYSRVMIKFITFHGGYALQFSIPQLAKGEHGVREARLASQVLGLLV